MKLTNGSRVVKFKSIADKNKFIKIADDIKQLSALLYKFNSNTNENTEKDLRNYLNENN